MRIAPAHNLVMSLEGSSQLGETKGPASTLMKLLEDPGPEHPAELNWTPDPDTGSGREWEQLETDVGSGLFPPLRGQWPLLSV